MSLFVYLDFFIFTVGMYCTFITGKYFHTILDKQSYKKEEGREGGKKEGRKKKKRRRWGKEGKTLVQALRRALLDCSDCLAVIILLRPQGQTTPLKVMFP